MNNNPKDILLKVLKIIGYEDDREAFANEFLKNVYLQSVSDLVKAIPTEQSEVKSKISQAKTAEELDKIVKEKFSGGDIERSLKNSIQEALMEWIKAVTPTLSGQQKQTLQEYFATFRAEVAA